MIDLNHYHRKLAEDSTIELEFCASKKVVSIAKQPFERIDLAIQFIDMFAVLFVFKLS